MAMKYRALGPTGTRVSALSLGSWLTYGAAVDQRTTDACVRAAFEGGINFFDTADVYHRGGGEIALGKALAPLRRQDYVLATKAFWPMSENVNDRGLSRKHLMESAHASLKRLGTDYLDLYQCHRFDPETPVEEVVRAMEDLIRQGKVLYFGVSVWTGVQIEAACVAAETWRAYRPVTNQPPYNLLERGIENEVVEACRRRGIQQIVFSPLAQGLLTGKYTAGRIPAGSRGADEKNGTFLRPRLTPENLDRAAQVAALARELGVTPAQLALAWILCQPFVASAIVGATRPEQVIENLKAVEIEIPQDVMARLDALAPPVPTP
jgi:aryl-alcohol dehydrogenase-like predicted oxidoreductase